ncbi:Esterase-like activity of phytase [Nitrosospira sp. Nsp1]|nr:Esterase-like activity of phytase [Nitrosospira sp. Nsp1]
MGTSPVAIAPIPAALFATNGLIDFIVVGDTSLLLLSAHLRLAPRRLAHRSPANVNAVTKTLLLDLSDLKHDDGTPLALDNIEGITFSPQINGMETRILVSDNNFNNAQFTQFQFVALQITPVPESEMNAMLLAGLVQLLVAGNRRLLHRPHREYIEYFRVEVILQIAIRMLSTSRQNNFTHMRAGFHQCMGLGRFFQPDPVIKTINLNEIRSTIDSSGIIR